MNGIALLIMMFALIGIGTPITFSLGISSLAFFILNDIPLDTFAQKMSLSVDNFSLLALPFFVLAGAIMNNGGITRRLFKLANDLLGSVRGGLSYVCILSSTLFSTISGSAMADAASLGAIQIKSMQDFNYDKDFAVSLAASCSLLAPIIPPSVIMIIYGVTAGASIREMFMGGVVPGIILVLLLAGMSFYFGRKLNFPKGEKFSISAVWASFKDAIWALFAPIIILGGIFSGIFTATESGAIACLYCFIIGGFVYKDLKLKDMFEVILEAGKVTGTILFIAATASVLAFCLTYEMVPQALAQLLVEHIEQKYVLLVIFLFVYLFLGCIMDASPIVITTVPIFMPLCIAFDIDLVYFGVFVGVIMALGTITPPVGQVMFILCRISGVSITRLSGKLLPWYAMAVGFIFLLIIFPDLVLFLPTMFFR